MKNNKRYSIIKRNGQLIYEKDNKNFYWYKKELYFLFEQKDFRSYFVIPDEGSFKSIFEAKEQDETWVNFCKACQEFFNKKVKMNEKHILNRLKKYKVQKTENMEEVKNESQN